MQHLIEGISRFRSEAFPRHRERFRQLATRQAPETLFITCSDSRIVPSIVLDAGPGDLFVSRNAGNIVPPHGASPSGESATIEYAVQVLGVRSLVVCGHSDCGAMRAVLHPEKVQSLKAVAAWLRYAASAEAADGENHDRLDEKERLHALIEKNVLAQIANLRTHPSVAEKLKLGTLEIQGWVFDIANATFTAFDEVAGAFRPLSLPVDSRSSAREVAHG